MAKLVNDYFFKATGQSNGDLACYVAGYNTRIDKYGYAIKTLRKLGYDVLAFDCDPAVLEAGNPQFLLDAIDNVTSQVEAKAKKYKEVICMGVSLGGFMGYNVQKRITKAHVGAYADCGVEFVPAIFNTRYFHDTGKRYLANGYNQQELNRIWKPIDVQPAKSTFPLDKSFIVFDGTKDKVINFFEARNNIEAWAKKGIRVKQYPVRGRGHFLTAIYFIRNTKKAVSLAKSHHITTA